MKSGDLMSEQLNYAPSHLEMRRKRNSFSGSFKAQVLCELLNRRTNLKELAQRYNVHPNQIRNWKTILLKEANQILDDKRLTKTNNCKIRNDG
jgi:transposase